MHQLEYKTGSVTENIETFFNSLKSGGHLNDADVKSKTIPLRVFIYHMPVSSDLHILISISEKFSGR